MGKKLLPAVLIAFAIGAAIGSFITLKSCGPDKGYWVERAVYDRDAKDRQDRLDNALGLLAEKEIERLEQQAATSAANERILDLELQASAAAQGRAERDLEIKELKTDAAAAIAANPAIRRLVEAFELGRSEDHAEIFTLKKQIAELGIPIENGTDPATGKKRWLYPPGTTTGGLYAEILTTREEREIWKKQYGEEHGLRLTSDSLRVGLERKLYGGKFWKIVALVEPPIFASLSLIF
jgi:hypothetical protein